MNKISRLKQKFSKIEWYKQGAATKPLYIGYPWKGCCGFSLRGKRIPLDYFPFGVYIRKDFMDVYFSKHRLRAVGNFYYRQEIKHPGVTLVLKQRWERVEVADLKCWITKVHATNLTVLSNEELLKCFTQFSKIYVRFWRETIFLDAFDLMSEVFFDYALKKEGRAIPDKDLGVLSSVDGLSWLQRERKELLGLALRMRGGKDIISSLKQHATRWHWIYNDYAVVRQLDWKFFLREARKLSSDPNKMRKESKILAEAIGIKAKKKALAKSLHLSKQFMVTINFLVTLAKWRDSRKTFNQMSSGAVYQFVKEFSRRTGFSKEDIEYLWHTEILDIFKMRRSDIEFAGKRRQGLFAINDPSKKSAIFLGEEGKKLAKHMAYLFSGYKELKGRPAYAGVVRGIVKIVLTQKDFYKMKQGDILVAPNTRPEYVPVIKIAAAIVSEEGGLTCHTAIVSRELKIPALVGVQGAIAALKDGDRVEVDAVNGIVRKL